MDVLILQVFVSLGLVGGSVLLYAFTCRARTFEHADRLSLLPINDDVNQAPAASKLSELSELSNETPKEVRNDS